FKVLLLEFRAHGIPCVPVGIGDEVRVLILADHAHMVDARSDSRKRLDSISSEQRGQRTLWACPGRRLAPIPGFRSPWHWARSPRHPVSVDRRARLVVRGGTGSIDSLPVSTC